MKRIVLDRDEHLDQQIIKVHRKIIGLLTQCGEEALVQCFEGLPFITVDFSASEGVEATLKQVRNKLKDHDAERTAKHYEQRYGQSGLKKLRDKLTHKLAE
jgi:hypothetical protein